MSELVGVECAGLRRFRRLEQNMAFAMEPPNERISLGPFQRESKGRCEAPWHACAKSALKRRAKHLGGNTEGRVERP